MKRFNSFLMALACLFLLTFSTACSREYVQPGYVGVLVHLHGGDKGVDHQIVGAGRYYVGMNDMMYKFPTFLQNYNYTKSAHEGKAIDESFSFQDKQGMTIGSDVGVSYSFMTDKIDSIFQKFHKGPEEITDVFLRSVIRDSFNRIASTRDIQDIYGSGKATFINEVQADVQKQAVTYGIKVDKILLINELRLPGEILKALNEKVKATQDAMASENQLRITQADAAKLVAKSKGEAEAKVVSARGEAEANRLLAASITPILIEKMKIEQWDGKLPQVQGSNTPFITLSTGK